jgi:hypothetical protein
MFAVKFDVVGAHVSFYSHTIQKSWLGTIIMKCIWAMILQVLTQKISEMKEKAKQSEVMV